jgi:phosphatidate phosphatase APP1
MRPHPAGAVEDAWNRVSGNALRRRGWRPVVMPYTGYGNATMLRVLARVVLARPTHPERPAVVTPAGSAPNAAELDLRGWRNFFTVEIARAEVTVTVTGPDGERTVQSARTDRSGYLDVRVDNPGLAPGWREVTLSVPGAPECDAAVLVVDPRTTFGLVSDIDDTVIRTFLPRPLIAAYNTFVVREQARSPVPGMAELYRDLLAAHPAAPTVYVSTGAWNTMSTLQRFLQRNGFPAGPLLLTDWGPTNSGWFRSGQDHKRACLRMLAADLPTVRWLLVGDDGQHDPSLYAEFAAAHPDRVRAIALRQLSVTEQVLALGTAAERQGQDRDSVPAAVPEVRAPDGDGLARELARLGVV